jgi:ribosome-binding factor A
MEQLEEDVRQVLASALMFEMRDPGLDGVTVTRVKLSPDLSYADVRYTLMSSEAQKGKAQQSLERAAGALKREISSRIKLRRMPNLRFHFDDMVEEERRIGKILEDLQKEKADATSDEA